MPRPRTSTKLAPLPPCHCGVESIRDGLCLRHFNERALVAAGHSAEEPKVASPPAYEPPAEFQETWQDPAMSELAAVACPSVTSPIAADLRLGDPMNTVRNGGLPEGYELRWKDEDAGQGGYAAFLAAKLTRALPTGLSVVPDLGAHLFPHQADLTTWALRRGRAAIFAATGLGKTRCELAWANAVARYTGGKILVLAPLAVAPQTVAEAAIMGIQADVSRDTFSLGPHISVTNYERLHKFNPDDFTGVVCDESSVIKHSGSKTFATLCETFKDTPFKLCATATPAPNDYTELGTHAEFLGICTKMEMLAEFFVHDSGTTQDWRIKGHARSAFWRWVASWAALVRNPADLGYDGTAYQLPPLRYHEHIIPATVAEAHAMGLLFVEEAGGLMERRRARKASLPKRVEGCVATVTKCTCDLGGDPASDPETRMTCDGHQRWIVWCNLNAEQDALEEAFGSECISIYGALDIDEKERRLLRFIRGEGRILLSKSSMTGFGINLQMVSRQGFVGVDDSWESFHQAIRRSWRFGQRSPVDIHAWAGEAEGAVLKNLARKEVDAAAMAEALARETSEVVRAEVRGQPRTVNVYAPGSIEIPRWLVSKEGDAA